MIHDLSLPFFLFRAAPRRAAQDLMEGLFPAYMDEAGPRVDDKKEPYWVLLDKFASD